VKHEACRYQASLEKRHFYFRHFEDDLDEDFEDCIGFEPIQKSRDPEGSLTDHLRSVESNRNGANKRHREARRKLKEFNITTQWGKDDE
jgi:hypothetical protein